MKKVNIESKSGLAKLMADEGLHVIHDPKEKTASFNVKTRILKLPILKNMTNYIYDAFIAHEIGHALYTPYNKQLKELLGDVPHSYFNVTEDARIEKLVKRRYPGSRRNFAKFYKDLSSEKRDFFGIYENKKNGKDLKDYILGDRINLYFKVGIHFNIPFHNKEEISILNKCKAQKTYQDAIDCAKLIYEYDKNNYDEEQETQIGQGDGDESDEDSKGNIDEESEETESLQQTGEDEESKKENSTSDKRKQSEDRHSSLVITTQKSFDESFKRNEIEVNENFIVADIYDYSKEYKEYVRDFQEIEKKLKNKTPSVYNNSFYMDIKPITDTMVSLFNMKKSAQEFQKIQYDETGIIDLKQIAQYKTKDNIFLTNEIVHESKNHGLFILLDWSSSMNSILYDTLMQLIILLDFCKKANIPFEVYTFSSVLYNTKKSDNKRMNIEIDNGVKLSCLFSSDQSLNSFKKYSRNILDAVYGRKVDRFIYMGQTPTKSALILSEHLIKNFRKKYNIEKLSFCIFSDGIDNDYLHYDNKIIRSKELYFKNKNNHRYYKSNTGNYERTSSLIEYLKDECCINSVTGYYITDSLSGYNIRNFLNYEDINFKSLNEKFQNKKHYTVFYSGPYDRFYFISPVLFDNFKKNKKNILRSSKKDFIFMNNFIDTIS